MPRKVVSGPDYDDEYDHYDEYGDDYDDYDETGHADILHPVKEEKESLKKSSSTVPVLWRCSMCMFDNHESMVYCEMCGVFRESFVKSAKDGSVKDPVNGIPSNFGTPAVSKTDSAKMPVKTRTTDFDCDSKSMYASTSHDKVNSTQSASVGSSSGTGKKKQPFLLPEEDVPVERTTQLIPDHFQLKEDQSSRASSSLQNEGVTQTNSSDISQLSLEKNNVNVTKPYLPEEYKPEKWMLVDPESGALSQLNLAIVGHVDSGKSTLSGRLLHLLGRISKKDMHKNEKEAKEKVSAAENQNLINPPSDARLTSWYQGFCLLDAIDSLQLASRAVSKPLILPICDVIKSQSTGQLAAFGKLETGAIKNGSKVLVLPCGQVATVKTIERDSCSCSIARAGDNVAVSLLGVDGSQLIAGGVLCHPGFPVPVAKKLELKVRVLDITTPILVGFQVEFHIHHVREAAKIEKIVALLDKTGKPSKTAPRFLKSKQNAVVQVTLDGAVCVQEFSKSGALGRAFLRSSGSTIAVGIVHQIIRQDQN